MKVNRRKAKMAKSKSHFCLKKIIDFLINIGKLKKKERRGWILRGIKNPETIGEHTFRVAIMAWLLGREKKLNIEKLIKMALIHDLAEIYAGDATPYDGILPKDKRKQKEILNQWPRFSKSAKIRQLLKRKKVEKAAIVKLISKLSPGLKKEIMNLWLEFNEGLSKEGKLIRQVDKTENLLQALEYWKEDKNFPIRPWWIQIKELIDVDILFDFIEELDKKFHKKWS